MEAEPGPDARERSPLAVGFLTLALLLSCFWLSGALFGQDMSDAFMSSMQMTGTALTYSTIPAFVLAAELFGRRRMRTSIEQLVRAGRVRREAAAALGIDDPRIGPLGNLAVTIVGLVFGALNVFWAAVIDSLGTPWMFAAISLATGNLVVWVVVVHIVVRRVRASHALRLLGRDHIDVDLLRLDTLLPFGRVGMLQLLMVVIALSLSAFQSLDAELRWVNYGSGLAIAIPAGLALLFMPMTGIRQSVRRAKAHALEGLDEAIRHASRELEPDAMRYLGDLLQRREVVRQAREWPLDTTAVSRIAFYVVIPPIAWVGGAIAEILLERTL